jgi:hypothetical protein
MPHNIEHIEAFVSREGEMTHEHEQLPFRSIIVLMSGLNNSESQGSCTFLDVSRGTISLNPDFSTGFGQVPLLLFRIR